MNAVAPVAERAVTAIDALRADLAAAERVAAARAAFDQARAGRPERWAPAEAKAEWEAAVCAVYEARGCTRGEVAFIARAAGVDASSVWRALHGRGGNRAA